MAPSESNAKSIMIDRVLANWDLDFGPALIEIGGDSGLLLVRSLGGSHFCECASPLSDKYHQYKNRVMHLQIHTYPLISEENADSASAQTNPSLAA